MGKGYFLFLLLGEESCLKSSVRIWPASDNFCRSGEICLCCNNRQNKMRPVFIVAFFPIYCKQIRNGNLNTHKKKGRMQAWKRQHLKCASRYIRCQLQVLFSGLWADNSSAIPFYQLLNEVSIDTGYTGLTVCLDRRKGYLHEANPWQRWQTSPELDVASMVDQLPLIYWLTVSMPLMLVIAEISVLEFLESLSWLQVAFENYLHSKKGWLFEEQAREITNSKLIHCKWH